MTNTSIFLPKPINLPNGMVARITLTPMPQPDGQGRYQPDHVEEIRLSFFRGEKLIEERRWETVICGEAVVTLADGSMLDEENLEVLDSAGWDQMLNFGVMPGALV